MKKQGTIRYGFNAGKALSKFMTLMMVIVFAASVPSKAEIPQGSLLNEVRCAACGEVDNSHLTRISDFRAELSNRNSALSVQRGQFAGQVCLTYRLDCFASLAMTLTVLRHCEKIFDFRGSLVHMSGNA